MRLRWAVPTAVGLLVAGAATAVATVAVHQRWPLLQLAGLATALVVVALPAGWATRLSFGLGWTVLVAWVVTPRAEGDYVVSSDPQGYALLGLALLVLVFSVATLPRRGHGSPATSAPAPRMTR